MLVREMHIELDLILKRLNSNSFKRLQSEEKDWALNRGVWEFINSNRVLQSDPKGLGYEEIRTRYENVQSLLESVTLPVYKLNDTTQYAILPSVWFNSDAELIKSYWDCSPLVLSTANVTRKVSRINLDLNVVTAVYYTTGFSITTYDSNNVLQDTLATIAAISDIDSRFEVIKEIIWKILEYNKVNSLQYPYEVYWESFDGEYRPNTLFIVTDNLTTLANTKIISQGHTTITTAFVDKTYTKTTTTATENVIKPARLVKTTQVDLMNDNSFYQTTHNSPLITLEKGRVYIHTKGKFVSTELTLRYIRQPKLIKLALDWHCDLEPDVHYKVCQMAANVIAIYSGNKNMQGIVQESSISV